MSIVIDHTIVQARDPARTAAFLTSILGLEPARQLGPFTVVAIGPTSIDLVHSGADIAERHFAFRVSEAEFDSIFERIRQKGLSYWADPSRRQSGEINHWDDGRGVYFNDPNGHLLEIITHSYGSNGCQAKRPHPLLGCDERG